MSRKRRDRLGALAATAICGNDITSSCLYVSALAILRAGRLAPLVLLLVAGVLHLFRPIYAEVVGALPLNGGAYNALLNTTSKSRASMAACLTILSYMATAVISASEAMHYVHSLWPALPVREATVGLLGLFLGLTVLGITESAMVAVAIFLVHLATLALLLLVGAAFVASHGLTTFVGNLTLPEPGGVANALLFGFSAAMLGISGFESSANFVEEQAEGVFAKTLRNMWTAVTVFNPGMAILGLALVPIPEVAGHQEALLAHMGRIAGGEWLSALVSIDAGLVLSGAVLTSYVGVNGLVRRMTLDRCLPQFLLKTNRRGTTHRILVAFFLLAVSILLITRGQLGALAGVYTISFLGVMALFGLGNILLKVTRRRLPRPTRATWPSVLAGLVAVMVGLFGNAWMNPAYLAVFLEYFVPTVLVVGIMLGRIALLKTSLYVVRSILLRAMLVTLGRSTARAVADAVRDAIERISSQPVVFFSRGDNVANLNRVMLYVLANEHTHRVKVVTVVDPGTTVPPRLERDVAFLNEAYPDLDIELVVVEGRFGPKTIRELSERWQIPTNLMFIGHPGGAFPHNLADLGGVRLII